MVGKKSHKCLYFQPRIASTIKVQPQTRLQTTKLCWGSTRGITVKLTTNIRENTKYVHNFSSLWNPKVADEDELCSNFF
jgi:hypothetical protein